MQAPSRSARSRAPLGDSASLGFVAETERQVESHLRGHIDRLGTADPRSRAILEQMTHDEMQHGAEAASLGGKELPFPVSLRDALDLPAHDSGLVLALTLSPLVLAIPGLM